MLKQYRRFRALLRFAKQYRAKHPYKLALKLWWRGDGFYVIKQKL